MKDTIIKVKNSIIHLMEKDESNKQRAVERAAYERLVHCNIDECDYYTRADHEEFNRGDRGVIATTMMSALTLDHSDED